jgi:PAS domain S-box-containing protein
MHAIRTGEVDAVVVARAGEEQVVTFAGADLPYRILLDQMFAGAVTLTPDGVFIYCNTRFADIVRTPIARVIGAAMGRFVPPSGQPGLAALLAGGIEGRTRGELELRVADGTLVAVSVTFAPLRLPGAAGVSGVIGVVVDATERNREEKFRSRLIEQVMTAQDEERRRIARELHDETGQSLTAMLVGLRMIEECKTTAEAAERAEHLRAIVATTLEDVGRLARGLHPSILDDLGLAAAVTNQAQDLAELHGIPVDVRIEGLDTEALPPLLQTTVYRVVQEALTNVARHAKARSATVRLVRDDVTVELRVQDDGIGFDATVRRAAPGESPRRLGLQGIRERAALLGGSVEIESPSGRGTAITVRFPLRGL